VVVADHGISLLETELVVLVVAVMVELGILVQQQAVRIQAAVAVEVLH
jgi:hypothetical protein